MDKCEIYTLASTKAYGREKIRYGIVTTQWLMITQKTHKIIKPLLLVGAITMHMAIFNG